MTSNKRTNFQKLGRNIMLVLGSALIMGTASCGTSAYSANCSTQAAAAQDVNYAPSGIPMGVSADCSYGNCSLSIAIQSDEGQKSVYYRNNINSYSGLYSIDAMIQAEMNDGDNEPITVILNPKTLRIDAVNIEGKLYQP